MVLTYVLILCCFQRSPQFTVQTHTIRSRRTNNCTPTVNRGSAKVLFVISFSNFAVWAPRNIQKRNLCYHTIKKGQKTLLKDNAKLYVILTHIFLNECVLCGFANLSLTLVAILFAQIYRRVRITWCCSSARCEKGERS